jgi:hypothetical protein
MELLAAFISRRNCMAGKTGRQAPVTLCLARWNPYFYGSKIASNWWQFCRVNRPYNVNPRQKSAQMP